MKTNLLLAAAIAAISLSGGLAQAAQPATDTAVTEAKKKFFFKKHFKRHYYYHYYKPYYYHCPYPHWSWKAKKYCYGY